MKNQKPSEETAYVLGTSYAGDLEFLKEHAIPFKLCHLQSAITVPGIIAGDITLDPEKKQIGMLMFLYEDNVFIFKDGVCGVSPHANFKMSTIKYQAHV